MLDSSLPLAKPNYILLTIRWQPAIHVLIAAVQDRVNQAWVGRARLAAEKGT